MSAPAFHHRTELHAVDSLTTYLEEISGYPLLTRADEAALSKRIRAGDKEAVEQLVCANLRFVVAVAKKYQHQGVALADLINEGNIGLMRAAAKFDDGKGVKFISYAVWWIRQAIVQCIAEQGHSVRLPVHRAGVVYRIGRRVNALRQELGREPTQDELVEGMDLSPVDIETSVSLTRADLSLDAPVRNGQDASLLEFLPDPSTLSPDEDVLDHGLTTVVTDAFAALRAREAQVLKLYFGFEGNEPMTLEAIGVQFGVTRERVRQIKERALSRLRKSDRSHVLAAFAGR